MIDEQSKRDSEMLRSCADAMGIKPDPRTVANVNYGYALATMGYNPLKNDEQAMALVKKFCLDIEYRWLPTGAKAYVRGTVAGWESTGNIDLNRAIVECVAKMHSRSAAPESISSTKEK